jgi:K+-sensing histidine kinase KdpD
VAAAILDFVREERVGVLVMGRPSRKGLWGRIAPGIVQRVLENTDGIDVMVADIGHEGPP